MTTTVVNNSLFRSLFEKQKLNGNNFMEWYRNLRIMLSTEDKLPFLEQPIPTLPVPPAGQANPPDVVTTHQAQVKAQKEIDGLMLMTMNPDIQKNLEHLGAFDMLKELKSCMYNMQIRNFFIPCKNSTRANKKKGSLLALTKIRRIRACTHQRPQRKEDQYAVSRRSQYAEELIRASRLKKVMGDKGKKTIMETFAPNDKADYYSGITNIIVNGKNDYELKGKFLDDLHNNAFSGTNMKDAAEHIE
ncbi:hypothetical protein Tco_1392274 [Tanacetum coccineum]